MSTLSLSTTVRYAKSWQQNLLIIDIDSSHTKQKNMMHKFGAYVEPFVETSTPPSPPLGWISDRGRVARQISQLPKEV